MNTVIISIRRVLLVLLLPVLGWAQATVEIHQVDVGAGDATLINIRNDGTNISHSILIDAGDRFETPTKTVLKYIRDHARKVNSQPYLDYIIASHYDADHIGGLAGAVEVPTTTGKRKLGCSAGGTPYSTGVIGEQSDIRYFALLDKGDQAPTGKTLLFRRYKSLAGARRVRVGATVEGTAGAVTSIAAPTGFILTPALPDASQQLALGGVINLGKDVNNVDIQLRLILADGRVYNRNQSPRVTDVGAAHRLTNTNPNNWGLGWVLEYGAYRYYTAGDVAGENSGTLFNIETYIADAFTGMYTQPANNTGHICAQKVSHHGSDHSSRPAFLSGIKCAVGIISAGTRHDHPRQDVLGRLESTQWNVAPTNLAHTSTTAYLMTELFSNQRLINLAKGYTSGSMYWFTDPTASTVVADKHTMLNGGVLSKLKPVYENLRTPGHVVIKVAAVNTYSGSNVSIANRSIFKLEYAGHAGAVLSQTINCHNQ